MLKAVPACECGPSGRPHDRDAGWGRSGVWGGAHAERRRALQASVSVTCADATLHVRDAPSEADLGAMMIPVV